MSNRIDTVEATIALLKRLEQKGVRSVYLDGVEVPAETATPPNPRTEPATPARRGAARVAPEPASTPPSSDTDAGLADLAKTVSVCTRCALHQSRKQTVFGVGNPHAKLMFIGEAPGADEDAKGEPFVGRAGQLLNKIIAAMGMKREDVYIGNILKCRPPQNRDPQPAEVQCCEEYLRAQIALIQPKYICALGRIAAHWLLKTEAPLGALRAGTHTYEGIPVIVTYHPAALLRNPGFKAPCWEDMKKLMALLKDA
ncbi:MAG TPA: uracil-DNA glycosylase [Candidatus Krumholzibacteria bacterium]|nr:uracil-DNA glycosylase [Candidatus Krumholzibacteria bacterium]